MQGNTDEAEREMFGLQAKRCSAQAPVLDPGRANGHPQTHPRWSRTLADGRVITLSKLIQTDTYDGMLCGLPGMFEDEVALRGAEALQDARKRLPDHYGTPVLLTPQRITGFVERTNGQRQPWHRVGFVTSVAVFESGTVARDPRECYSSLAAVWFQDTFGMPTDAWVLAQIDALDWTRLAWDWTP